MKAYVGCLVGLACATLFACSGLESGESRDAAVDAAVIDDAMDGDTALDASGDTLDATVDEADAAVEDASASDADTPGDRAPRIDELTLEANGLHVRVALAASDADDDIISIEIDWGDGVSTTLDSDFDAIDVAHDYEAPGSFEVTVTIIDAAGAMTIETREVTTGIPRAGLLLELLLSNNADDTSGEEVEAIQSRGTYDVDRFNMGASAVDLHNGNETGSEGLISTPYIAFSESFTLALWIAAETFGNRYRIMGQGEWVNLFFDGTVVQLGIQSGLYPDETRYLLETEAIHQASDLVLPDRWTFYAATVERDGTSSRVRIYQDGVVVASDDAAPLFINPGVLSAADECRFFIGHEPDNNACNGSQAAEFGALPAFVDDIRVYDRALTPTEVLTLYAEGDWPSCCSN